MKGGVDSTSSINGNLTGTTEGKTEEHYTNDGKKTIRESGVDIDSHNSKAVSIQYAFVLLFSWHFCPWICRFVRLSEINFIESKDFTDNS